VGDHPTVGFYGKLPCRGDFLQRRVPREFVDPWDAWLQECLTESRRQLQERWLDTYLVSPVWRFAMAGGLCGESAYAGALLPSVDLVGRYFPLTIVARWEVAVSPLMMACGRDSWFELVQVLALEALEAPVLDLDDFDRRVAALGSRIDVTGQSPSFQELERRSNPVSLWWTEGSNDPDPARLCVSGLPDSGGFAAMLAGP
jgi:type VI secretion system protein ImpM